MHSLQTGYGDINKETPKDSGLLKMEGVWVFVFCLFFALSLTRVQGLVQWLDGVRTPNAPICPGLVGFHAKTWKVLGKPRRAGAPGVGSQGPSAMLVCQRAVSTLMCVTAAPASTIIPLSGQQRRRHSSLILNTQPRSCIYNFCSPLYCQNMVTWPHLAEAWEMSSAG